MSQPEIQIRPATRYDQAAVARLRRLNGRRLRGRALVAEAGGEIVAAIDMTNGTVAVDPARSAPEYVPALRRRRYELMRQGGVVRHARFALAPRIRASAPPGHASAPPGTSPRRRRLTTVLALGVLVALATAAAAAAFQALPPGAQVNDDPAAGINPAQSVSGEDPTNADVVGGSLVAGNPAVPWSVFRQQEAGGGHDQIFSRSFAKGAWTTRGNGTVGGRSSASPTFAGSLNFDQAQDGEAPAIDFAGAGRTVPWATWYENTTGTGFGANNVFASRFDVAQNKWVFAGQSRGNGGTGPNVPSLNIHTDESAENPSVAGGSAVDPTKPGPWVTWQETEKTADPTPGPNQIFVSKPLGPGMATCNNVNPAGVADGTNNVPAIGGFCFQDVGVQRVGPGGADPSLNVDVKRDGIEPDIAFTGANDGVPWVVWYEQNPGTTGLAGNELVFAAKGEPDTSAGVVGGFHWHVIGNTGNGILNAANSCAGSLAAEQAARSTAIRPRTPRIRASPRGR